MLDRLPWSAMLDPVTGDLLNHPLGAYCSTRYDGSAMLDRVLQRSAMLYTEG